MPVVVKIASPRVTGRRRGRRSNTQGQALGDDPERIVVPPLTSVTAEDVLYDVDDNGSSAEIVEGPGRGEVLQLPHGDEQIILPANLCDEAQ